MAVELFRTECQILSLVKPLICVVVKSALPAHDASRSRSYNRCALTVRYAPATKTGTAAEGPRNQRGIDPQVVAISPLAAPRTSQIRCTTEGAVLYNVSVVKISVSKARERLSEIVEMSQTEPVELQHYGKRAAVLVSPQQYDEMREAFEESEDLAAFDAALAEEGGNIPWEQVKADLGWS